MDKVIPRFVKKQGINSGQSLVELALTFVALLLLVGGAVDVGRAFFGYIAIRDSAQEGATYASLNPNDPPGIFFRVRNSTSIIPINLSDTSTILIEYHKSCKDSWVQVIVTYKFKPIMPLMSTFFGPDSFDIPASVFATTLNPICNE